MFYLISIGLQDEKDISVRGLEIVQAAKHVYLEEYTSVLTVPVQQLELFYGRPVVCAAREALQEHKDRILDQAQTDDVVVLVVGDALSATTHADLLLAARRKEIPFQLVHNASIVTAVSVCGLALYNYGQTVSIPFFTDTWQPESFFDKIVENKRRGLHTLCLLDIKINCQSEDAAETTSRFMTAAQAIGQILLVSTKRGDTQLGGDSFGIAALRVGTAGEQIQTGRLHDLQHRPQGSPLHSLVIPGEISPYEAEYLHHMHGWR